MSQRRTIPSPRQIRLLLPLGAAIALSLTGDSTMYAVLPNEAGQMGISLAAVGVMLGANRLIRIPANPLAGALYDRTGRRKLFLLGLGVGILSTLGYSVVYGFGPLLATRLLWGLAWSLINVGGYTMVLDWSTASDRGRMTGFHQISYMVGLSISPILGGALTDALGFQSALRICALISGAGLVAALVGLPETRPPAPEPLSNGEATSSPRPSLAQLGRALRNMDRDILLAGYVYMIIFFVSNGVLMSTVSLYLGQRWGDRIALGGVVVGVASLAGVMLALRASMGILAGPAAGVLSDRMGNRWPIARGGIVLGVAGFVLLALPAGIWIVPVGVSLVAMSSGALIAVLTALVGDLAGSERKGVTMGVLATAGDLGSAAGPLLAYALAVILDLHWIYLLCALILVSGLVAMAGQRGRRGGGQSEVGGASELAPASGPASVETDA